MKLSNTIWLSGTILFLSFSLIYFKKQYDLAKNYCYKIIGVNKFSINKDYINTSLDLKLLNRSSLKANIIDYNFGIKLNNKYLGKVYSNIGQTINANSVSVIKLDINISHVDKFSVSDIVMLISNYQTHKENINFNISGYITISVKLIKDIQIPFKLKININETLKEMLEPSNDELKCPDNF